MNLHRFVLLCDEHVLNLDSVEGDLVLMVLLDFGLLLFAFPLQQRLMVSFPSLPSHQSSTEISP